MSVSIAWTDATGSATLTNGLPTPGDRLGSWTPRDESIGPTAIQLSTGRIYGAKYRRDGLVAFEMRNVPGANLPLMLRLKLHLMKGGTVDLTADNELAERWAADATLAPGTVPSITFADNVMLEYTFGVVLRNAGGSGGSGGSGSGGCIPVIASTDGVIAQDYPFRHKDAFYYHDFGESYASEAAWRASFRPGYLPDADNFYYYNEEMPSEVTLSTTRKFNCRSTMRIPSFPTGSFPGYQELSIANVDVPNYQRAWSRTFVWFDPATPTALNCEMEALATTNGGRADGNIGYHVHNDVGGSVGVVTETWECQGPDAFDATSPETFTSDPFSGVSGRWVSLVTLVEDDSSAASRTRQWRDGVLLADRSGAVSFAGSPPAGQINNFYTAPAFLCDGAAAGAFGYWVGLIEFVGGGTQAVPVNPYSGLAGITGAAWVPSAGDSFADRIVITGASGTRTDDNTGCTAQSGEPNLASGVRGSTWFEWTAPSSGTATFDTLSTAAPVTDTLLGVYTGSAINALTEIAFNDDAGAGALSQVSFSATSGTVYKIQTATYNTTPRGPITLEWSLV